MTHPMFHYETKKVNVPIDNTYLSRVRLPVVVTGWPSKSFP